MPIGAGIHVCEAPFMITAGFIDFEVCCGASSRDTRSASMLGFLVLSSALARSQALGLSPWNVFFDNPES